MLTILDKYIIKKFLGAYFMSIILIISIAVVFDFSEKLDDFLENDAPAKAIAFDYSLAIGEWILDIGHWTLDHLVLSPEEAIAQASKVMTIRQGDLIYIQQKQAPRPVHEEEIIRVLKDEEEILYCKIK